MKNEKKWTGIIVAAIFLVVLVAPVNADWNPGDDYKMHYPQLPNPSGWDVDVSLNVADDWQCTETGLVTDIHIWGSWYDDLNSTDDQGFNLRIRENNASKPGNVLWSKSFLPGNYTFKSYYTGLQGFYYPDPKSAVYEADNHNFTFQYNFYIDPSEAFFQEEGNVYWLQILPSTYTSGIFGVKDSNSTQFGSSAVFWDGFDYEFVALNYSDGSSMDLAFVITGGLPVSVLEVNKTVLDPETGNWVKKLTAKINDTLQFNCTITNTGNVNLTQLRFWDILDCSLEHEDPCYYKPIVLHPEDGDWNLSDPADTSPIFRDLCPCSWDTWDTWGIVDWVDHDHDGNVSVCDQVELGAAVIIDPSPSISTPLMQQSPVGNFYTYWYHVDRVPYTLNLSNANGTTYFDSVLDWEAVNLSDPINSTWLEVCCCKDQYTLVNWSEGGCSPPGLSQYDTVTMRNELTGEEEEYTVDEVVIDLVVSREDEIDYLLKPGETIWFNYSATVVRCGVDNNTYRAKVNWSGNWVYSNEDVVTITVPCPVPSGEATDPGGLSKEVYTTGEPVYAVGSGFAANKNVSIYIIPFQELVGGENLENLKIVGPVNVTTDGNGDIGPVLVWPNPVPGRYLIVFDDPDGDYDPLNDPLDEFSVVGEVPVVTPLGIVALIGLLSFVALSTLIRRKKR